MSRLILRSLFAALFAVQGACASVRPVLSAGWAVPTGVLNRVYRRGEEVSAGATYAAPLVPVGISGGLDYVHLPPDHLGWRGESWNSTGGFLGVSYTFPVLTNFEPRLSVNTGFNRVVGRVRYDSATGYHADKGSSWNPSYRFGAGVTVRQHLTAEWRATWMCCVGLDPAQRVRSSLVHSFAAEWRF